MIQVPSSISLKWELLMSPNSREEIGAQGDKYGTEETAPWVTALLGHEDLS